MSLLFVGPIEFKAIEGWGDDDLAAALRVFGSAAAGTPPKTRGFGVDGAALQRLARLASRASESEDPEAARRFFERHFIPHRIEACGFVTGYFEPQVAASRTRTDRFKIPLYRRPNDLVEVAADDRPPGWGPEMRFARRTAAGLAAFFDRGEIEAGALAGRGLELAWLADPVDAFFIHVQGSARLSFPDGGVSRISFDGKSGHAYTSIGRLAVERGLLAREAAHKDGLEAWLKANRAEGMALMRENRSFIFFRETGIPDDSGPLGAAGVPLTAGRSLAVDRTLHTFQSPIWVEAAALEDPDDPERGFRRLMVAQDTGSAIVGAARGDIFFGSGDAVGSRAGRVSHAATMILLVPNAAAGPT